MKKFIAVCAVSALFVAGCANSQLDSDKKVATATGVQQPSADAHAGHNHNMDGGAAPAGMHAMPNAKYPVGTTVKLTADHMPGMAGSDAKIVGAFHTTTYSVNYLPTDGGSEVIDHKWVVAEELTDVNGKPLSGGELPKGAPVQIQADHMAGMKGAKGTVESSTTETVYMVDVLGGSMPMKNHKWVTESEISAK